GVCACGPVCGNGMCESGETASTCPADCKNSPVCGNGTCESGETVSTCPADCKNSPVCGNGTCESGETASSCPADCKKPVCGNGTCESGETASTCPADCKKPVCGNGTCESGETESSCPADCQKSVCGNGKIEVGEECDGDNIGMAMCSGIDCYIRPRCTSKCKIDYSVCNNKNCSAKCGDKIVQDGEQCDGGKCCNSNCTWNMSKAECIPNICGDNVIDMGEECDKNNFGVFTNMADACVQLNNDSTMSGAKPTCDASCHIKCVGGSSSEPTLCGNGKLDPGEFCDGDKIINNYTCESIFGPGSKGKLKCDETCLHTDKSSCTAPVTCGDGKVTSNERCDPNDTNDKKFLCSSSYSGSTGKRICDSMCRWDDSSCVMPSTCGNGVLDAGEQCDPKLALSYAMSCELVYGPGSKGYVTCTDQCKLSYNYCSQSTICGNNQTDNSSNSRYHEACDGTDVNGKTCAKTLGSGYTGKLKCLSNCSGYDYSECVAPK
ncbi:MAG: hypothetical protein II180_10655, partial [Proteobacteria bacterium]|nr:hypothetical protein [Pseudomonadota bacterium]